MSRSKFLTLVLIFIFAFRIWQTTGCQNFKSYHFNPLSIKINVEEQTGIDVAVDRNISRFFHNKISAGIFELTKSFASIYKSRLLVEILGPVGLILTIFGLYDILKKKKIVGLIHIIVILTSSSTAIFIPNSKTSFYILAFSLYSFSFWGHSWFAKPLILRAFFILLAVLTFWYFLFNWQMPNICDEIYFK
ncbi:hypothetical protein A2165_01920 [Candidatus Curtissbacteria bacterium RBG_13_40_7]|uniref:Uncharacterized protein n=1 Tax=Candidatus Curtissbacteria bacterium RBG_13_40_7 TaxID=1797706 RepID=A0A1F5FU37_9BACT|nr:MAG: hypothetical protein A2165_01920 [Candidatus Curtissbacteria bacterium RBG_13_40_7]